MATILNGISCYEYKTKSKNVLWRSIEKNENWVNCTFFFFFDQEILTKSKEFLAIATAQQKKELICRVYIDSPKHRPINNSSSSA